MDTIALRPSRYNLVFRQEDRDRTLVYNTSTGVLAVFGLPGRAALLHAVTEGCAGCEDVAGLDTLVDLGFFVSPETDERRVVEDRYHAEQVNDETMRMMICTTLGCNFSCDYCFEGLGDRRKGPHQTLSVEVQDAIVEEVRHRLPQLRRLEVSWFGGEPLLNRRPIERLGNRLRELVSSTDTVWDAEVITNGYLLNRSVAEWLVSQEVTHAQVTLDGDPEMHDSRRFLGSGVGTFSRIVDNVVAWQDILEPKIRINVDRRNVHTLHGLVDALVDAGVGRTARLHFGLARNFTANSLGDDELSGPEFRASVHPAYEYAIERGINVDYGISLKPKGVVCNAARPHTLHVGTDGQTWKCFPCIGTSRGQCGNLLDPQREAGTSEPERLYDGFDPFADERCKDCALLPVCLGRCPYEEFSLCANSSVCDMYQLDEFESRLDIVERSGNLNNNVADLIYI